MGVGLAIHLAETSILAASFLASPAWSSPIRRGAIELAGTVSFDRTSRKLETNFDPGGINPPQEDIRWTTTTFAATPTIGWFVTDGLELVSRFPLERVWETFEGTGEDSHTDVEWSFGATGLVVWNFRSRAQVVPYLGGGGGALFTEHETTTILPHLQGGLRFPFGDGASFNTGFFYERRWDDDVMYHVHDGDTWEFGILLGLSAFL